MRKFRNIVMMFALILAVSLTGCGGYNHRMPGNTSGNTGQLKIQYSGQLDAVTVQGMNDAMAKVFSDAKALGQSRGMNYTRYLSTSDYVISVRSDCQPDPKSGVMAWQEYVPDYGLIWQAERVEIKSSGVQTIQICKDIPETMANTTRYGAEHIILYFNDRQEFERTKVHTTPTLGHPIIPIR